MKRKSKSRRSNKRAAAVGAALAAPRDDLAIEDDPDSPGGPLPEGVEQLTPVAGRDPDQTDIEHADERRVGSVETVPPADPLSGVAGFIESPGARSTEP